MYVCMYVRTYVEIKLILNTSGARMYTNVTVLKSSAFLSVIFMCAVFVDRFVPKIARYV